MIRIVNADCTADLVNTQGGSFEQVAGNTDSPLVQILLVTNHVCLILKLIIRMKNRYRSGEAALPFFPFRYNKDNTLILCRCA